MAQLPDSTHPLSCPFSIVLNIGSCVSSITNESGICIYTVGFADQAYPIRTTDRATNRGGMGANWLKLLLVADKCGDRRRTESTIRFGEKCLPDLIRASKTSGTHSTQSLDMTRHDDDSLSIPCNVHHKSKRPAIEQAFSIVYKFT
jgi:hypothetical protein